MSIKNALTADTDKHYMDYYINSLNTESLVINGNNSYSTLCQTLDDDPNLIVFVPYNALDTESSSIGVTVTAIDKCAITRKTTPSGNHIYQISLKIRGDVVNDPNCRIVFDLNAANSVLNLVGTFPGGFTDAYQCSGTAGSDLTTSNAYSLLSVIGALRFKIAFESSGITPDPPGTKTAVTSALFEIY